MNDNKEKGMQTFKEDLNEDEIPIKPMHTAAITKSKQ